MKFFYYLDLLSLQTVVIKRRWWQGGKPGMWLLS